MQSCGVGGGGVGGGGVGFRVWIPYLQRCAIFTRDEIYFVQAQIIPSGGPVRPAILLVF